MQGILRQRETLEGSTLSEKRVIVVGGAGFIGSHLCDAISLKKPDRLLVIDDFSLGKAANLGLISSAPNVEIYRQDASDFASMLATLDRESPDVIFNLGVVPLPASLVKPRETIETNIAITTVLCELLRQEKYGTLVHCSSSEAYGSALYIPMDESHPEQPLTPYAASKIACDHIALSYHKTFGADIGVVRPFNCYGPRQNEKSYAGVIPLTIGRIMAGESPIIYGDGEQTRDYTYVEDTVEGIIGVYETPSSRGKVVNIANGTEVSIGYLIESIAGMMGYQGAIVHEPARPGDVRRHKGDISLAKSLFNFTPKVDLEDGLRRTIQWYSDSRGRGG
jgi:UDP-glucose 4-epimerase